MQIPLVPQPSAAPQESAIDTAPEPSSALTIQLFGSIMVRRQGAPIPKMRTRKEQWLLALLVLSAARNPIDRVRLAGMLWPESVESAALYNLRRSLGVLRDALDTEAVRILAPTPRTVQIDLEGVDCDVLEFDAALRLRDEPSLLRAVALYTGPLLRDCSEDWIVSERATRKEGVLAALETLAVYERARGDISAGVQHLRRALEIDSLREPVVRSLMEALADQGSHAAAGQAFREFRFRLRRELNADPDPETMRLNRRIQEGGRDRARIAPQGTDSASAGAAGQSTHVSGRTAPDTLPIYLSSFLGRAPDLARLREALIDREHRVVTIVGPGGLGKTRIAVEAARSLSLRPDSEARFPGGVFFTDCAALPREADVDALWQAVAASLLREQGASGKPMPSGRGDARELVVSRLQGEAALLILDNVEHLVASAAAMITAVLSECPELTLLNTSRISLGLSGEWLIPLQTLPMPSSGTLAAAEQSDAVLLFAQRAQGVRPDFTLNTTTAAAISTICRLTDGLPLALELAAARLRLFSLDDLARRLSDPLRILSGGEAPSQRHRSLLALMAWSYDPLPDREKAMFCALSVFPDAFTLEAAEAISGAADGIDALGGLVDSSLVQVTEDETGGTRYRLLDTIRAYSSDCLQASCERDAVRKRLGAWARGWVGEAYEGLWGPEGADWLRRIARELANLKAAINFGEMDDALITAHRLDQFWWRTNRFQEGLGVYSRVMARPGGDPFERITCRMSAEVLKEMLGEPNQITEALAEGITVSLERGHTETAVTLHHSLALALEKRGRFAEAIQTLQSGLEYARGLGNDFLVGYIQMGLAEVDIGRGSYDEALKEARAALEIFRAMDRHVHSSHTLLHIGKALLGLGRFDEAQEALSESLSLARQGGMKDFELDLLIVMADSARAHGDLDTARTLYTEVLTLTKQGGPLRPIQQARSGLAQIEQSPGVSK